MFLTCKYGCAILVTILWAIVDQHLLLKCTFFKKCYHNWHKSNVTYTIVSSCNYVILKQTSPPMQYCFAPKIYLHPLARESYKLNRTNKTIETKANVYNHYAIIYQNLVSVILKLKTRYKCLKKVEFAS
jgi:hypothetical protein